MKIEQAMILAAGLGNRMRPLTNDRPKPMVEVMGKPIIDYAIEALKDFGITNIVANTHYRADVIEPHLHKHGVRISHEDVLLDTGGGIKNALQYFDRSKPLLILAGDSILLGKDTLPDLAQAWDGNTMDLLLLLQPLDTMVLTPAVGDYALDNNIPRRTPDHSGGHMWTSARILNPKIFENTPDGAFSFLSVMDAAEQSGRLGAQVHKGTWHHLTTPDDVNRVNAA
jgi:MurNAc alpha-1-phosphate uridylyltransferase